MLDLTTERFDQLQCAFRRKANQVNHNVCPQRADAFPESTAIFLLRAIDLEARHELPSTMLCVRFAPATADSDDLMPGSDQSRDQVRSYMSGTTNDDDTHDLSFLSSLGWTGKNSRTQEVEESRIQEVPEAGSKEFGGVGPRAFAITPSGAGSFFQSRRRIRCTTAQGDSALPPEGLRSLSPYNLRYLRPLDAYRC